MKTCSKCKEDKPLSLFTSSKATFDGLYSRCKECSNVASKEYRSSHRKEISKYKSTHSTEAREYRKANFVRDRARVASWAKDNPTKVCARSSKYRALKKGATVESLPEGYWDILINIYGANCMNPECLGGSALSLDHIISLSKGGSHSMDNFQILCRRCNSGKGDHHSTDYRPVGLHV